MKRCFKCGRELPLEQFHKCKRMADGHLNKCKDCACLDARLHRIARPDYYTAYEAVRSRRPERKTAEAVRIRRRRRAHPEKVAAWDAVARAKKKGVLVPTPCVQCGGEVQVEGHHDDYTKKLDVEWLCRKCHHTEHRPLPY